MTEQTTVPRHQHPHSHQWSWAALDEAERWKVTWGVFWRQSVVALGLNILFIILASG